MTFPSMIDSARIAAGGMRDFAAGLGQPTLRLGGTGLARSGQTVRGKLSAVNRLPIVQIAQQTK